MWPQEIIIIFYLYQKLKHGMVRTLMVPKNQDVSIQLPESYIGKQVEIIAFTVQDTMEESLAQDKTLTHFASQKALAKDWLSTEEDQAWQNL